MVRSTDQNHHNPEEAVETLIGPFAWYIRKSDKKNDLERQITLLEAWIQANKVGVPDLLRYADTGSRDLSKKRPDFQRMLKDAKKGLFKTILVAALDRFGIEDTDEFISIRTELRKYGVTIYSIAPDEGDLSSKDQQTLIKIFFKAEASATEQRHKGSRAISGKFSQLTKGPYSFMGGPTPYGYDKECRTENGEILWTLHHQGPGRRIANMPGGITRRYDGDKTNHPSKSRKDRITLVPSSDTQRIEIVKMIFDLWVTKDVSILAICKRLNSLGLRHYGDPWKATSVRHILENPVYTGALVFNRSKAGRFASIENGKEIQHPANLKFKRYDRPKEKWVVIPDTHVKLIDQDVFDRAEKKLAALKWTDRRPARRPELWLRRFCYCGHCNRPMEVRKIGKHDYLFCATRKAQASVGEAVTCDFNSVRLATVEKLVNDHFAGVFAKLRDASTPVLEHVAKEYLRLRADWWSVDREFVEFVCGNLSFDFNLEIDSGEWAAWKQVEAAMNAKPEIRDKVLSLRELWDKKIRRDLEGTEAEHKQLTLKWVRASEDQMAILTAVRDELEVKIKLLRAKLSTTVIDGLDALLKLAEQFRHLLAVYQEVAKKGDPLEKAEALRPILDRVNLFFTPKTRPKSKSHLEKCEFVYCDGSEVYATGYAAYLTQVFSAP